MKNRKALYDVWHIHAVERKEKANYWYEEIKSEHEDRESEELFFDDIIKYKIMPSDSKVAFPFSEIRNDMRIDNKVLDETENIVNNQIYPGLIL